MNLYLKAILIGLLAGYIGIPLFIVGILCKRFNWKNIKKVYYILFQMEDSNGKHPKNINS
jgi:hypothetical protein